MPYFFSVLLSISLYCIVYAVHSFRHRYAAQGVCAVTLALLPLGCGVLLLLFS